MNEDEKLISNKRARCVEGLAKCERSFPWEQKRQKKENGEGKKKNSNQMKWNQVKWKGKIIIQTVLCELVGAHTWEPEWKAIKCWQRVTGSIKSSMICKTQAHDEDGKWISMIRTTGWWIFHGQRMPCNRWERWQQQFSCITVIIIFYGCWFNWTEAYVFHVQWLSIKRSRQ